MQKAIDVVKPVCPTAHQHYQIRRWLRGLPSLGWMDGPASILVLPNWIDPCQTRILTDGVQPEPITDEVLQSLDIGASLLSAVEFGTWQKHQNCRCVVEVGRVFMMLGRP